MSPKTSSASMLPLRLHWEKTCHALLDLTEKMPKRTRFTFVIRLESLALQIQSQLIHVQFTSSALRLQTLKDINLAHTQLKALLRLAYQRKLVAHSHFETLSTLLFESGKQIGGWLKAHSS